MAKVKGDIVIDIEKCKGCQVCIPSCPNDVIGMSKNVNGKGYRYAHDHEDAVTDLDCLPERLRGRRFYRPEQRGFEQKLGERLERWLAARRRLRAGR